MRPGNGITGFAASSDAMCGQAHRWLYTSASRVYVPLLDRLLYRHPFEGGSARRYARDERPAFGDLDDRLLDHLAPELAGAARLLDVGCGPGTFARRAAERFAALDVVAIEPSRDFARPGVVRAAGEALPLADRSVDVAICLSSITPTAAGSPTTPTGSAGRCCARCSGRSSCAPRRRPPRSPSSPSRPGSRCAGCGPIRSSRSTSWSFSDAGLDAPDRRAPRRARRDRR
ncbi:MAG: class I SAM-dependent methyltransferase [Deltaproteobacteria bacterium]|nr:MAG: class I SAM-dependent methyltransferase [Deltaproteobacteria bacterium]